MTPAYRKNSRPMDGHLPADWDTARRAQWRADRWLVPLVAVLGVAVMMLAVALGAG